MKIRYTGELKELQKKGYELYDSYVGQYYRKEIVNLEDMKQRLACYIDIKTSVVDFVGCREYEHYFKKELEGLLEYEEDKR